MSKNYSVLCVSCDDTMSAEMPHWAAESIARHAKAFAEMKPFFAEGNLDLHVLGRRGVVDVSGMWIAEHATHGQIVVVDEYGSRDDECRLSIGCKECGGHKWNCKRPIGHDGPCSQVRGWGDGSKRCSRAENHADACCGSARDRSIAVAEAAIQEMVARIRAEILTELPPGIGWANESDYKLTVSRYPDGTVEVYFR